jgi:hypothetical protein
MPICKLQFAVCNLQLPFRRTFSVVVAIMLAIPMAASAGELQWRSGRSAFKTAQSSTVHTFKQAPARRVDSSLRSANFDNDSELQLGPITEGNSQFRSVIVPVDDTTDSLPLAQLPASESGESAGDDGAQSPPEEEPGNLFEPMPGELPPLDSPLEFDVPAPAENGALQLDREQRQPPADRGPIQGRPFQPAPLDTTMPPGPLPDVVPTPGVGTMQAEREKSVAACEQGLSDLQGKTIDTLNLSIAVTGDEGSDYPFECSLDEGRWHEGRCWEQTTYMWKASALCHKPLYFEDEQLERYGHSWPPCCQPFVSGAHFFTRLPILPYCMGVEPPNECIYALGHYRPGSCAPYMCNPVPLSARGALFQAGAVVGAAAVLP